MSLTLSSPAFQPDDAIPEQFTCEGEDRSPPLHWDGVPEGAKSLALVIDDPDAPDPAAPKMTWVHWVLFNLPADGAGDLPEGVVVEKLPAGTRQGLNNWHRTRYGGPCPPVGRHRYRHKLFALDTILDLTQPSADELERAMEGHIVAKAELVGTYQKHAS